MLTLLVGVDSIYKLEKSLKGTNYATVWRHTKNIEKKVDETLNALRKNGNIDMRH